MGRNIFKLKVAHNEAGKLHTAISEKDISRITHLTISGKINANDFETMRKKMWCLSHIDLRECDIEAIDGHEADKVPEMAFTQYVGYNKLGEEVTGAEAYYAMRYLRKVILPKSATVIGKRAFCNAKKLRNIILPRNLFCICDEAFNGCIRLRGDLNFPPSLKSIGEDAFNSCNALKCELIFPEGLANIGDGAFQFCPKVYNIVLPKSDCKIGIASFSSCERNGADLIIPEGCEKIEALTFSGCQYLNSVDIPATCEEIGDNAFSDPLLLNQVIVHATTPPKLGKNAFVYQGVQANLYVPEGCYEAYHTSEWRTQFGTILEHTRTFELTEAGTLENLVTYRNKYGIQRIILKGIVDERDFRVLHTMFDELTYVDLRECSVIDYRLPVNAFLNCKMLSEVILPDNIISIGDGAFCGCRSLRKVNFSNALRKVGDMAFYGCIALSSVEFKSTITPQFGLRIFNEIEGVTVIIPEGCAEQYREGIQSDLPTFIYIVERTKKVISNERWAIRQLLTIEDAEHITHLTLEGNIDQRDFIYIRDNCHRLEELNLLDTTIMKYNQHEADTIPENALCVTCYDLLFEQYGMKHLKKVILPHRVTTIGKYAFGEGVEVIEAENYCPF